MKKMLCACLLLVSNSLHSAPIVGGNLTIDFTVKNNNNALRNKTAPNYQILKDGYGPTIWIEGPYDPLEKTTFVGFERQNIKLTKSLVHFGISHERVAPFAEKRNPWAYADYRTADFRAALVTAGQYRYYSHDKMTWPTEAQPASQTFLAPVDARRADQTNGSMFCDSTTSVIGHYPVSTLGGRKFLGDISGVDGISSATIYADSTDSSVSYQWDMTDNAGNPIQEGWYLVTVMLSSERFPRKMEGDTVVRGRDQVDLETAWDDPQYDTLGHHRVVNLYHFTSTNSFTVADNKERKWKRDPYNYFSGPVTLTYTAPNTPISPRSTHAPARGSTVFVGNQPFVLGAEILDGSTVEIYSVRGTRAASFAYTKGGLNRVAAPLAPGFYTIRYRSQDGGVAERIVYRF